MKRITPLLLALLLMNSVFAQLPFPSGNFSPLPGTLMQTVPDSYAGYDKLSFDHLVPTSSKGFMLNMLGTMRSDLDIDMPICSETGMASTFEIGLANATVLTISRSSETQSASVSCTVPVGPVDPENPVIIQPMQLAVYDEMGIAHMLTVFPGILGSIQHTPLPVQPGQTPVNTPYLLAMNIRPDNSRTVLELHFHYPVQFMMGSMLVTGRRLDLWVDAPYTSIPSVSVSASGNSAPVPVSYYEWQTMPPSLNMPISTNAYTGDEVLLNGINLDYIDQVNFNGLPLDFFAQNNTMMSVRMPDVPGISQLTLLSEHGNHVSTFMLNVAQKPECSKMPEPNSLFFYPATSSSMSVVYKWKYDGDPSSTFEVEYREVTNPAWTSANTGMIRQFTIAGATPGAEYEFRVRALCPNLLLSEWSEEKVLALVYADQIDVSTDLNSELRRWREDTIHYYPMDSFLTGLTGPLSCDPLEASGFLDRFFHNTPGFPALNSPGDCVCKKVIVDLAIVKDNQGNKDVRDETHSQDKKIVGKKLQWYNYYGASQRNAMELRDFETWCDMYGHKKNNKRRHTDKGNRIEISRLVGDTPYKYSQAVTTLSMSYICANKTSAIISWCGCEKKVYVTAESKVDICATATLDTDCKEAGCRAEAGFGSIITTGLLTGNPQRILTNVDVVAAGFYNIYRERWYTSSLNPDFVKKGISLIFNTTMAVLTAGTSNIVATLIAQGYMQNAINDLTGMIGTKMYNVAFETMGTDGCKHYSIMSPDPFYITLYPNQERYVTIATTSYTGTAAHGCRYNAKASMAASHHLAAATDRLPSSLNPGCCLIPTAAYSAYSVDQNADVQDADAGHKHAIGRLLYLHGDVEDVPLNVFDLPYWLDIRRNRVSFDEYNYVVTPWLYPGGVYTRHGRLQGYPVGCNVDSMGPAPAQPTTGLGSNNAVKEKTTLNVYPNTAQDRTNIEFTLSAASDVTLTIYDMAGRKVAILINNESKGSGTYNIEADLQKFKQGQYIVLLSSRNMNAYKYLVKQ